MTKRRRIWALLLAVSLLLTVSGCRRRIVDSGSADMVIDISTPEPTSAPTPEPTSVPTPEPTPELTPEPTLAPNPEPTPEPTPVPITAPAETETPAEGGGTGGSAAEGSMEDGILVTFDANRGECDVESITLRTGEAYGELPEAYRSGFEFTGWYPTKNGGTPVTASDLVTVTESQTLYAHWAAREGYTLTLDPGEGRLKSSETERPVYVGEAYGELPTPVREGYDLDGWFTEPEGGDAADASDVFEGTEDLTFYARWTYNPFEYWTFVLTNTTQQIYSCQQVSVYLEYDEDNVTTTWCPLISDTGSFNIAYQLSDTVVTDDWVLAKKPDCVVKCVGDMSAASEYYSAMAARFPDKKILIVPAEAVYGSESQRLYYDLAVAKLLYAEWYTDVDPGAVGAELGVGGTIYTG